MKRLVLIGFIGLVMAILGGCRLDEWREVSFSLPDHPNEEKIRKMLAILDTQTPPGIFIHNKEITIRYNSLRVSSKNFEYVLNNLDKE